MPIYEYECEKCGAHTEVLQKMGDKPLTRCSTCRGKMRKGTLRWPGALAPVVRTLRPQHPGA